MSVWERRHNPLLDEWVIIAGHRGERPWSGETFGASGESAPDHDPSCYLCPGVTRAKGETNPQYSDTYAFDNDFPSLAAEAPPINSTSGPYRSTDARGICRVLCYSPKHNITLAEMDTAGIGKVIDMWQNEYRALQENAWIKNILIFENKGKIIGVSNPHPHGQIYATGFVPVILGRELENAKRYHASTGNCVFCDIIKEESSGNRIIFENDHFTVFVPWFARLRYETMLLPKRHVPDITGLTGDEKAAFAEALQAILVRYDNLFGMIFPNIKIHHNMPVGAGAEEAFHFHLEFQPPLRTPDTQKYLAGFESGGGNIINPSVPETSAGELREAGNKHYKKL